MSMRRTGATAVGTGAVEQLGNSTSKALIGKPLFKESMKLCRPLTQTSQVYFNSTSIAVRVSQRRYSSQTRQPLTTGMTKMEKHAQKMMAKEEKRLSDELRSRIQSSLQFSTDHEDHDRGQGGQTEEASGDGGPDAPVSTLCGRESDDGTIAQKEGDVEEDFVNVNLNSMGYGEYHVGRENIGSDGGSQVEDHEEEGLTKLGLKHLDTTTAVFKFEDGGQIESIPASAFSETTDETVVDHKGEVLSRVNSQNTVALFGTASEHVSSEVLSNAHYQDACRIAKSLEGGVRILQSFAKLEDVTSKLFPAGTYLVRVVNDVGSAQHPSAYTMTLDTFKKLNRSGTRDAIRNGLALTPTNGANHFVVVRTTQDVNGLVGAPGPAKAYLFHKGFMSGATLGGGSEQVVVDPRFLVPVEVGPSAHLSASRPSDDAKNV